jgi:hypothetical protein
MQYVASVGAVNAESLARSTESRLAPVSRVLTCRHVQAPVSDGDQH